MLMPPSLEKPLSKAEVETAVRNYWQVTTSKEAARQQDLYSEVAIIFTSASKRVEPARLVNLRRQREYLSGATRLRAELGPVEVMLLGPDAALAVYTMQFDAENKAVASALGNKASQEHLQ